MSEAKKETVNHPDHYNKHPSGVECITVVEHFGFNIGNAIKYLWRAGFKSPDPKEDLKKAVWYVQRELERLGEKLAPIFECRGCAAREPDAVVLMALERLQNTRIAKLVKERAVGTAYELKKAQDELEKVQDELKRVRAENAALEVNHADKADLLRRVSDLEGAIDARDRWLSDLCGLAGVTGFATLRGKIEELKAQAAKAEALEELLDQMRKGEKERAELQTALDAVSPKPVLPHPEFGRWVQVQTTKDGPVQTLKVRGYLVCVRENREEFFDGQGCVPCGPPNDAAQPATPSPDRVIQKIGGYVLLPFGEIAIVEGYRAAFNAHRGCWDEHAQYRIKTLTGVVTYWIAESCVPYDRPETKPPVG